MPNSEKEKKPKMPKPGQEAITATAIVNGASVDGTGFEAGEALKINFPGDRDDGSRAMTDGAGNFSDYIVERDQDLSPGNYTVTCYAWRKNEWALVAEDSFVV